MKLFIRFPTETVIIRMDDNRNQFYEIRIQPDGKQVSRSIKELTQEDFSRIKEFSDRDYHQDELHYKKTTRLNISLDENLLVDFSEPALPDEQYIIERLAKFVKCNLNEKQRRWFHLFFLKGLSAREIARQEGVAHTTVSRGIEVIRKKIKKLL